MKSKIINAEINLYAAASAHTAIRDSFEAFITFVLFRKICKTSNIELPICGGRLLLMRGGDFMVTYEAISAFATVGLFVIAVITLLLNNKR